MKQNRLQLNCIKYCKSEGIYHTTSGSSIFVCINEKFVAFHFDSTNQKDDRKLEKNGGRIFRPPTLEDFVKTIREIQGGEKDD